MQNPFIPFVLLLFMQGVFGADETVTEGGSVTLHTGVTEIQNDDVIEWNFGPQNMFLCQITKKDDLTPISLTDDVGFRGRLQVDHKTGSLTIRNTRIRHSGQYKLTITSEQTTTKMFKVTVQSVVDESGGGKSVSVTEGGSITLQNDVKVQRDDLIVWRFGDKGVLLAKYDVETTSLNGSDERFRDRLQLDHQTGSLTITNTRTEDAGLYELQITGRESSQQFLLSVYAVPDPGLSPGAVVGIVFAVVAAAAAAVIAGLTYYMIPKLQKQTSEEIIQSVIEGDDVNLKTNSEMHRNDEIQWLYGSNFTIATIKGKAVKTFTSDEKFRGRLDLDKKTGSLTIKDIRFEHTGEYTLKTISSTETTYRRFIVYFRVETKPGLEGENVTLKPENKIQRDDKIEWKFGNNSIFNAQMQITGKLRTTNVPDERFRNRLKLDDRTGSLTITNITTEYAGDYKLVISNKSRTTKKKFNVLINLKKESVMEGKSVTLNTDIHIQKDDQVEWKFETEKSPIAKIPGQIDDAADGRFRDRLKLDNQTGSLTIRNITTEHAGVYKLKISSVKTSIHKAFIVDVSERRILVKEGEVVTIETYCTEVQKDDLIMWMFGEKDSLIARMTGKMRDTYDGTDGRFKNRLQLDEKTGSLTISNITTEHAGDYKLQISSCRKTTYMNISVEICESPGNRVNESPTVVIPLLNGDEQE